MAEWTTHARFEGPIVMIGFGSIGRGTLPLILRHIDAPRDRMLVIDPDDSARAIAEKEGIRFRKLALTRENLRSELEPLLKNGGFLVNLSVEMCTHEPKLRRKLARVYAAMRERIEATLRDAVAAGELPKGADVARLAEGVQALTEGSMVLSAVHDDPATAGRLGRWVRALAGGA